MSIDGLPAPMMPADVDLTKLDGFILDTARLIGSELVALSTGDEFKAAVLLWCRAWKQRPACSLPEDDRVLASFAGVTPSKWQRIKAGALRGFVKCADGRLYHAVLCQDGLRAWELMQRRAAQTASATRARRSSKGDDGGGDNRAPMQGDLLLNDQRNDDRYGVPIHRHSITEEDSSPRTPPGGEGTNPRPTRLPKDWQPSAELRAYAAQPKFNLDPDAVAERFVNYWIAEPGKHGFKLDWDATFKNWCRTAAEKGQDLRRHDAANAAPHALSADEKQLKARVQFMMQGGPWTAKYPPPLASHPRWPKALGDLATPAVKEVFERWLSRLGRSELKPYLAEWGLMERYAHLLDAMERSKPRAAPAQIGAV